MIGSRLVRSADKLPITGWRALLLPVVAVAAPTIIRLAMSPAVTGCEFTPYLPFVFLSAILLSWWEASAVALSSALIVAILSPCALNHSTPSFCYLTSAGIFVASAAVMIAIAELARRMISQSRGHDENSGGIVFSLDHDTVWASWYGPGAPLPLGPRSKVTAMMKDFLAQEELAERLNRRL